MISSKTIKELARKKRKKIGKLAVEKVEKILKGEAKNIIEDAAKEADFMGRQTIKEEDILLN